MRYMWNGREARFIFTSKEYDYLKSIGFIEVPGFELDRHLPSEAEVKQIILDNQPKEAEYETKVMSPKKKKLFKTAEGDK